MSDGIQVKVDLHGLAQKLELLSKVELKAAFRSGVSKIGTQGRTLARAKADHKSGIGRAGISKTTPRGGDTVRCTVYYGGPHAYIMRWQDEGTGERHTKGRKGKRRHSTGRVEPQRLMERTALELEAFKDEIMEVEIEAAIVRSGLA